MNNNMSFKKVFLLPCIMSLSILAACSDEVETKDSSKQNMEQDITPEFFILTSKENVEPKDIVSIGSFVVEGIENEVKVTASGKLEFSVAGDDFSNTARMVRNGQTITARMLASDEYATRVTGVLTLGDYQASSSVTTKLSPTAKMPDAFSFASKNLTEFSAEQIILSDTVTVTGLTNALPISVSGGEFRLNDQPLSNLDGLSISNNDSLTLAVSGLNQIGDTATATVTVGEFETSFTATAMADVTPDDFVFTPVAGAKKSVWVESEVVTISGLNTQADVKIENGEFSIDDADYTNTARQVENGQRIKVRVMSSAQAGEIETANLTIGDVTKTFEVTTKADTAQPTTGILFPPKVGFSSGDSITVRASAEALEAGADIQSVKIIVKDINGNLLNEQAASLLSDGSWGASVSLTAGENLIYATATDTLDVTNEANPSLASVQIRKGDAADPYPAANGVDGNNIMFITTAVDIDEQTNQLFVTHRGANGAINRGVIKVDLATGTRSLFAGQFGGNSNTWNHSRGIFVDKGFVYPSAWQTDKIYKIPVDHSDSTTALGPDFEWVNTGIETGLNLTTQELSLDTDSNRVLLPTKDQKRIFEIDLTSGAVAQLSEDDIGFQPEQAVLIPAKGGGLPFL